MTILVPVHEISVSNGVTSITRLKEPMFTANINTKTFELSNILFAQTIAEEKKLALYKKAIAFTKHYLRSHDNK